MRRISVARSTAAKGLPTFPRWGASMARIGKSNAVPFSVGKQLRRRVQSGVITQKQAERTARQRQTFKAAYGDNWREKVYGENVGALRKGLSGDTTGQFGAAYKQSLRRRKAMLSRAKAKLGNTNRNYL